MENNVWSFGKPKDESFIPLSITFLSVMKRCFRLTKKCFIDTKTFCIHPKFSPPTLKRTFSLMKTFCELKVGGFKPIECFLIEQEHSRPGIGIAFRI